MEEGRNLNVARHGKFEILLPKTRKRVKYEVLGGLGHWSVTQIGLKDYIQPHAVQ